MHGTLDRVAQISLFHFLFSFVSLLGQGFETQTKPGGPTEKTRLKSDFLSLENRTNQGSTGKTGQIVGQFNRSWNRKKLKKNAAVKI